MFHSARSTSCYLCTIQYSMTRVPVIICPNIHTICLQCYQNYIKTQTKCPKCQYKLANSIPHIPIIDNYSSQENLPYNMHLSTQIYPPISIQKYKRGSELYNYKQQKLKILSFLFFILFFLFLGGCLVSLQFRLKMQKCQFWSKQNCQHMQVNNVCQICTYHPIRICTCYGVQFFQYNGQVVATMVGIFVGAVFAIISLVLALVFCIVWRKKASYHKKQTNYTLIHS